MAWGALFFLECLLCFHSLCEQCCLGDKHWTGAKEERQANFPVAEILLCCSSLFLLVSFTFCCCCSWKTKAPFSCISLLPPKKKDWENNAALILPFFPPRLVSSVCWKIVWTKAKEKVAAKDWLNTHHLVPECGWILDLILKPIQYKSLTAEMWCWDG